MTVYLGIDSYVGQTLPNGRIAGINRTLAGLQAALGDTGGSIYTEANNRAVPVDETDSGVFNPDAAPRWFWIGGATQEDAPATDLQSLADDIRDTQAQIREWGNELNLLAAGEHPDKVTDGHFRLYCGLGALYLVANTAGFDIPYRKQFAGLLRFGATDVTKPEQFYALSTSNLDTAQTAADSFGRRAIATARWPVWVGVTSQTDDAWRRVALNDMVANAQVGNVPAGVSLLGEDWFAALPAYTP